jgi:hypothetical protein
LLRIEQKILQTRTAPLRVAVVTVNDPSDRSAGLLGELLAALRPMLRFNGMLGPANEANGNYREFTIDATHSEQAVGMDVVSYEPHIVLPMVGSQFTNLARGVALTIEQYLGPNRVRPFYVLNPVNASALGDVSAILSGVGQVDPTTYQRFLGINVAGADDPQLYHEYLDRLHAKFTNAIPETENYYDPIYYVAYSMYAAGVDNALDGDMIRSGMARLLFGKVFDVGPDPIPSIFQELRSSQTSIQLRGTMGLPLFHVDSGARVGRGALYCFADPDIWHMQEQVFDPTTSMWTGMFTCYPDFPR